MHKATDWAIQRGRCSTNPRLQMPSEGVPKQFLKNIVYSEESLPVRGAGLMVHEFATSEPNDIQIP